MSLECLEKLGYLLLLTRHSQSQAGLAHITVADCKLSSYQWQAQLGCAAAQGFARKLEGYDAADLRALVERALHEALMRRLASRPRPTGTFLCLYWNVCKAGIHSCVCVGQRIEPHFINQSGVIPRP